MMNIVFVDFETYWSQDHTLTKMSALEYVMHKDTELISVSIKINDGATRCVFGEDKITKLFRELDLSKAMVVGHNMSAFDSMILAWRLGVQPKMWGCTLAMARPQHQKQAGGSLAKLVKHYEIGEKDSTALVNTKGKHLRDFTRAELDAMRAYNIADTEQCAKLFHLLKRGFTAREMWHIDATIRMLVEPKFVLDTPKLEAALSIERDNKRKTMYELTKLIVPPEEIAVNGLSGGSFEDLVKWTKDQLMSQSKFATLLERLDVPTPMKKSPTNPNKMIPALSKSDEGFLALREHENPLVALAANARLEAKSTLLETRIEAFLSAARMCGGKLPVPLHYCGADTTGRWSGWLFNPQNLPRIPRDKDGNIVHKLTNALRLSILAPKGHRVIVADQSGIELRVNHFLWQVPSSMRLFKDDPAKADLYKDFASRLYDVPVGEVTKEQRQIGKVAHLGLGFGAGPKTFRTVAKMMGGVDLSEAESMDITYRWREEYAPIVEGWKTCHKALPYIQAGERYDIDPWGLCHTEKGAIVLPSGRRIYYPGLHSEVVDTKREWWYGEGRHRARIYAGKIDENIVQALARDSIADCAFEFFKMTKLRPQLMVHDELVYVVPEAEAVELLGLLQSTLRKPPSWWPELVTWSEGDVAMSYGDAK